MALTRPNLENILTNTAIFTDSMTVLHGGATQANVDVGFLMNRANGLVPNAAFYWSESTQSFVTALTANAGVTASNISVQSYANVTVGNVTATGNIVGNVIGTIYGTVSAATNATNAVVAQVVTGLTASNVQSVIGSVSPSSFPTLNQNTTGTAATVTTASQPSITTLNGLTSFGTAGVNTASQGNLTLGMNMTATNGFIQANGAFNETTTVAGVYLGNVASTPRVAFVNGTSSQTWEIDNSGGVFRWYQPGVSKMTLDTNANLSVSGNATISGYTTINGSVNQPALQITGTATRGGTGYHDFLSATNSGGGTNPNKYFRLDPTGQLQIINSAYTTNIFNLTDAGALIIPSTATVGNVITTNGVFWSNGVAYSSGGGSISGLTSYSSNSSVVATYTTTSTNSTSGALQVLGGVGVVGNLYAGSTGTGTAQHTLASGAQNAPTAGTFLAGAHTVHSGAGGNYLALGQYPSLATLNGIGVQYGQWFQSGYPAASGAVYYPIILNPLGGSTVIGAGITATSTTSGALVVNGGAGISGNLYVGGNLVVQGTTTTINNTVIEQTINAVTIGNIGANVIGTGTYLTSLNASNLSSGTVPLAQLSGITTSQLSSSAGITNAQLANNSITVTAGTGMSGGGAVSLGSSITLTNAGVTSAVAGTGISVSGATGAVTITNSGVTSAVAGTGISVSGATGAVTVTNSGVTSITGTTNQVTASASTGGVTLSLPQSIHTGATPTFVGAAFTGSGTVSATLPVFGGAVFTAQNFDPAGFNLSTYGGGSATSGRSAIGWNRSGGRGEMSFINNMDGGSPGGFSFYNWANALTNTTTTVFSVDNTGLVTAYNNIIPSANVSYTLGSSTAWWSSIYGTAVHAQYADLAEKYTTDSIYEPGTVVVFGGLAEVTTTTQDHDPRVAGVISTDPAYIMNAMSDGQPVAMTGRVPCQVQGPVTKGQVLVTSSIPGVAQAIDNAKFLPGCVLGKALETINTNTIETIEVVVGRF